MPSNHLRKKRWPLFALSLFLLLLLSATNIFYSLSRGASGNDDVLSFSLYHLDNAMSMDTLLRRVWMNNRTEILGNFSIHVDWHPKKRSERFPSPSERIKLYMGNWYHPPCKDNTSVGSFAGKYQRIKEMNSSWHVLNITEDPWNSTFYKAMVIDSLIVHDVNIFLVRDILEDCARSPEQVSQQGKLATESRIKQRGNMQSYCSEVIDLLSTMERLDREAADDGIPTPILAFFGDEKGLCDNEHCFEIPLIAKHRAGTTREYIESVAGDGAPGYHKPCWKTARKPLTTVYHQDDYMNRMSPILWKLELVRHWNTLPGALRKDTPWEQKKNAAYWGGDMTGKYQGDTDLERCQSNQRCRFVLEHADSKLVNARLCYHHGGLTNNTVNGTRIIRERVGVDIVQQFKVIISFEGNDVASGLKWMLQSTSVVLMPPPTRTSWAMEELLQPWIHYIPMHPNGSNAEERVQWVLDHDREARRIAERATLFIYDLVYHPDAIEDDKQIRLEMTKRYRALWH